jgi:Spy/CpxP family protein refolding chaperone
MMGYREGGPGYGCEYDRGYDKLTEEQRSKTDELYRKFYDETAKLRDEIWAKSAELDTLLNSANPDAAKAKALQKEISDLRARIAQERINFELEGRKIAPELRSDRGYQGRHMRGHGHGMGYGHHMGGYGPWGY